MSSQTTIASVVQITGFFLAIVHRDHMHVSIHIN